jgi:hypothetical protein
MLIIEAQLMSGEDGVLDEQLEVVALRLLALPLSLDLHSVQLIGLPTERGILQLNNALGIFLNVKVVFIDVEEVLVLPRLAYLRSLSLLIDHGVSKRP